MRESEGKFTLVCRVFCKDYGPLLVCYCLVSLSCWIHGNRVGLPISWGHLDPTLKRPQLYRISSQTIVASTFGSQDSFAVNNDLNHVHYLLVCFTARLDGSRGLRFGGPRVYRDTERSRWRERADVARQGRCYAAFCACNWSAKISASP
jgi:hypothetical protein